MTFLDALTEHLDAIDQRDIDRFAATLANDDVRFVGGDGAIIEGRENIVEAHRGWFASEDWTFDPQILWTREENETGLALTRVEYAEKGNSRTFLLLFVFVRENDDWKILYDQNTPVS